MMDADSTPKVVIDTTYMEDLDHPFSATLEEIRPPSNMVVETPEPDGREENEEIPTEQPQVQLQVPSLEPQERRRSGNLSMIINKILI